MKPAIPRHGPRSAFKGQFARFLAVGGTATLIQYVVLILLVRAGAWAAERASAAGFALSVCFNYVANRRFTFASSAAHSAALPRFMVVAGCGFALNYGLMYALVNGAEAHYIPSQIIATAIVLVWNFALNRAWTFRA